MDDHGLGQEEMTDDVDIISLSSSAASVLPGSIGRGLTRGVRRKVLRHLLLLDFILNALRVRQRNRSV